MLVRSDYLFSSKYLIHCNHHNTNLVGIKINKPCLYKVSNLNDLKIQQIWYESAKGIIKLYKIVVDILLMT